MDLERELKKNKKLTVILGIIAFILLLSIIGIVVYMKTDDVKFDIEVLRQKDKIDSLEHVVKKQDKLISKARFVADSALQELRKEDINEVVDNINEKHNEKDINLVALTPDSSFKYFKGWLSLEDSLQR